MEIQPGDFVDVTVIPDIASLLSPRGRRTECHFRIDTVVQLQAKPKVTVSLLIIFVLLAHLYITSHRNIRVKMTPPALPL